MHCKFEDRRENVARVNYKRNVNGKHFHIADASLLCTDKKIIIILFNALLEKPIIGHYMI